MSLLRNFCFTINNYNEEDENQILNIKWKYVVCGREEGKEGTPHLQGYMELDKRTRFNTVKKWLPRAHIEERKGTALQASEYCKKDGNFLELGNISCQGARSDLDKTRTIAMEEGMRKVTTICNSQQIKVAEKFLTYNEEPRDFKPEVIWLWGPTGTGKSRKARELCGEDTFTKNDPSKWWDGYDGHEHVIIDDFRPSWWPLTDILSLLDRYEKRVEFKGGYRQFTARKIIITSCLPPSECYKGTGESIQQLIRRIDHIVNMNYENVPEVPVPEVAGVILYPAPEIDNIEDKHTNLVEWMEKNI